MTIHEKIITTFMGKLWEIPSSERTAMTDEQLVEAAGEMLDDLRKKIMENARGQCTACTHYGEERNVCNRIVGYTFAAEKVEIMAFADDPNAKGRVVIEVRPAPDFYCGLWKEKGKADELE